MTEKLEEKYRDKADQWDAAQPMIKAMTEVVRAARSYTEHIGSFCDCDCQGCDNHSAHMDVALAALDELADK